MYEIATLKTDLRVVALTAGHEDPASRFRIRQNIPHLGRLGIKVREFTPFVTQYPELPGRLGRIRRRYLLPLAVTQTALNVIARIPGTMASYKADVTWISRSYIPAMEQAIRLVKKPRVLDVDDAIWLTTPFGARTAARFARQMNAIVVANHYLADWYSNYCDRVFVISGGIDIARFRPRPDGMQSQDSKFVIGWTGTSGNFRELYKIEVALARFLVDHPDARLCIVSNTQPEFKIVPQAQLEFRRWREADEVADIQDFNVGIMPLHDSEWTRGKNSNKMLCYMACGLPVVVSPVGTNKEILEIGKIGFGATSLDDWYELVNQIYCNRDLGTSLGANGHDIVAQNFSAQAVSEQLAKVFRKLA